MYVKHLHDCTFFEPPPLSSLVPSVPQLVTTNGPEYSHPRPSSSIWRQKQHSKCLHHNSQVNNCIFLCMFVLGKLWSARWVGVGGMDMDALLLVKPVSLVYCNMYNVSELVSVGRFNIQTNKKLPCKNSTPFICESWWMFQTALNIFQTYFGLNNDIFS